MVGEHQMGLGQRPRCLGDTTVFNQIFTIPNQNSEVNLVVSKPGGTLKSPGELQKRLMPESQPQRL